MARSQLNVRIADEVRDKLANLKVSYGTEGKAVEAAISLLHENESNPPERVYLNKLCNLRFKVCSVLNWTFTPDSPEDTTLIENGIDELAGLIAGLSDALKGNTKPIEGVRAELGDKQERIARARAAQANALAGSQTQGHAESIGQQGAEHQGVDHAEPYLRCDQCGREEQGESRSRPTCKARMANKQQCMGRMLLQSEGCTQDDYSQA